MEWDSDVNTTKIDIKDSHIVTVKNNKQKEEKQKEVVKEVTEQDQTEIVENLPQIDNFDNMGLNKDLLKGIYAYGFEKPSLIQQKIIPYIIKKYDILAQSQSGTGKTGTFVIGALQNINNTDGVQCIIISNTRDLSEQIKNVASNIGAFMKINVTLCVGGTDVAKNYRDAASSHVLVGTPGRILGMIDKGIFNPNNLKILILDEADKLLARDFVGQIKEIIRYTSDDTQVCIFSATMPDEAIHITNLILKKNAKRLIIPPEKLSLDLIAQYKVILDERSKLDTLIDLFGMLKIVQCMVYINSISKANYLVEELKRINLDAEQINGEMTTENRFNIMKKFRAGLFRILISTDLTSRGIDVQQVSCVINYDVPIDVETYLHRIGRSGRYGKKGLAINFVTSNDNDTVKKIETHYQKTIGELPADIDYLNNNVL